MAHHVSGDLLMILIHLSMERIHPIVHHVDLVVHDQHLAFDDFRQKRIGLGEGAVLWSTGIQLTNYRLLVLLEQVRHKDRMVENVELCIFIFRF